MSAIAFGSVPVLPPPPVMLPNRVLKMSCGSIRGGRGPFGAAASKYSAFIGESLPCDFPVAQRTANSRLPYGLPVDSRDARIWSMEGDFG